MFQWKTLREDRFLHFPMFGSIRKDGSKENYLWSMENLLKPWLIF